MSHRKGFQALGTAEALKLDRSGLTGPGRGWNQVRSSAGVEVWEVGRGWMPRAF